MPVNQQENENTNSNENTNNNGNNNENSSSGENTKTPQNTANVKIDENSKKAYIKPHATVQEIKEAFGEVTITDKNGTQLSGNALVGTGCKIDGMYTIIKKGDCNGDGNTNALDAAIILRYTVGQYTLEWEYKEAGSLDSQQNPTALDAAKILRYTVGAYDIGI